MKRDTSLTVMLTKKELEQIRNNANQYGLSLAAYVRMVGMKGGIK